MKLARALVIGVFGCLFLWGALRLIGEGERPEPPERRSVATEAGLSPGEGAIEGENGAIGPKWHSSVPLDSDFANRASGSGQSGEVSSSLPSRAPFTPESPRAVSFVLSGDRQVERWSLSVRSAEVERSIRAHPVSHARKASVDLLPGAYVAVASHGAGSPAGPEVSFVVDSGAPSQIVTLELPRVFSLAFRVLGAEQRRPVAGAKVQLRRVGSAASKEPLRSVALEDGRVSFDAVAEGSFQLQIDADGFVQHLEDVELPGRFEPWLVGGLLDLRYRLLQPQREVGFQLVGFAEWGGAGEFRIGHEVASDRDLVYFDRDGQASLVLGHYSVPVEVNLLYPNGDRGIVYLNHGFLEGGAPNVIDVSRGQEIEVDVRVAQPVADALFGSSVFLQASYTSAAGDSVQYATSIESEGVYSVFAPFAGPTMLGVTKVADGRQVVWSAREVVVPEGGGGRFTLNVEAPPLELQVVDGAGDPVPSAQVVVYTIPDRTNWIAAWVTDSEGLIELPRMPGDHLAMACYVADGVRAIDHPVRLDGSGGRATVSLGGADDYEVAVLVDGVSAS